jgi:hypothetical protein
MLEASLTIQKLNTNLILDDPVFKWSLYTNTKNVVE